MRQKKSPYSMVGDFAILAVVIILLACAVQLCTSTNDLKPQERGCLTELRSTTHKDTNFTEAEVVEYGRCIEAQEDD